MSDFQESDLNYDKPEAERRSLKANWKSCFLLVVMILGVLGAPLAVLLRLRAERVESLPELEVNAEQTFPDDAAGTGLNRIAYITLDHQLATISPDGSDQRQLTNEAERFQFPAWSPDGSFIAVLGGTNLFIISDELKLDPDEDNLITVYESNDQQPFYAYWSPDSSTISFLTNHPEGIALQLKDLMIPANESRILAVGQPFYWDWTPDGTEILMHAGQPGNDGRLGLIQPDQPDDFVSLARPGFFQAPGISPTGLFRAFAELDDAQDSRLIVQGSDGEIILNEPHLGQLALNWSPTEDILAFISPKLDLAASYGPLRVVDPSQGLSRSLTDDNVLAFFWSPDGRTIAYLTLSDNAINGIQVLSPFGKLAIKARPQRQSTELKLDLWSVEVNSGTRRRLARFSPTEVFLRQFLPFFDQYALSHRLWAPDSDSILMPMEEGGIPHIAIVPIHQGEVKILTSGEIAFWSHQ